MFLLAGRTVLASGLAVASAHTTEVPVTLEGRTANLGRELVSFGLPLPPGFLSDPQHVRVVDADGQEISAVVRELEPWRIGGRTGTIRSLLIQFTSDFRHDRTKQIKVVFQRYLMDRRRIT